MTTFAGQTLADLLDPVSVTNSVLDIEVSIISGTVIDINFMPTSPGDWTFSADSSSADYDVTVSANCTSSFLSDFRNLDVMNVRPNVRPIEGNPVTSEHVARCGMVVTVHSCFQALSPSSSFSSAAKTSSRSIPLTASRTSLQGASSCTPSRSLNPSSRTIIGSTPTLIPSPCPHSTCVCTETTAVGF